MPPCQPVSLFPLLELFAVRTTKLFILCVLSAIVVGCSDSAEQTAARKISQKVAQAREFMADGTENSYANAGSLLQDALSTPNATIVAKRPANELLASLLSQTTAIQLTQLSDLQNQFAQADADLRLTLGRLSIQAATCAQATGFKTADYSSLREYRRQLLEEIPEAESAGDAAVQARAKAANKLVQTQKTADIAALTAETLLAKAEDFRGEEYVEQIKKGTELRLNADFLRIQARDEELLLVSARQTEAQKRAVLLGLQTALESTEQLIATHEDESAQNELDSSRAKLAAHGSGDELIEQLDEFVDLGEQLSEAYQKLLDRQGRAVAHYNQALEAAKQRRRAFNTYQASTSADVPKDQRVQTLSGPTDEISVGVSLARSKLSLAQLRGRQAGVLQRALARIQQMEEVRKDLSRFGEPAAEGIIIEAPRSDAGKIADSINQIRKAALADLESAINTVWSSAMARQERETPPQDAEKAVKALKNQQDWNWQVWGMLGLAHQQRASLRTQMSQPTEASQDLLASQEYFKAVRNVRPDAFRSTASN